MVKCHKKRAMILKSRNASIMVEKKVLAAMSVAGMLRGRPAMQGPGPCWVTPEAGPELGSV